MEGVDRQTRGREDAAGHAAAPIGPVGRTRQRWDGVGPGKRVEVSMAKTVVARHKIEDWEVVLFDDRTAGCDCDAFIDAEACQHTKAALKKWVAEGLIPGVSLGVPAAIPAAPVPAAEPAAVPAPAPAAVEPQKTEKAWRPATPEEAFWATAMQLAQQSSDKDWKPS